MGHRIGMSVCQQCGAAFEHRVRSDREIKFCSRQCSGAAQKKAEPGNQQEMPCQLCGELFKYRPSKNARDRRYCSRECFNAAYSNAARNARTKPCVGCGVAFTPNVRTIDYCSRACAAANAPRGVMGQRACGVCEMPYQPTSNRQRWCTNCTGDKSGRSRLMRYGVSAPQWQRMVDRFDGACWICRTNPATAVDHCHETGRVRGALCRVCNMVLHYVERPDWWADAKAYLNGGDDRCAR